MNRPTGARPARHLRRGGTVGLVALIATFLLAPWEAGAQLPPLFPTTTTTPPAPPPAEPPETTTTSAPRGLESLLGGGTTTTAPPPAPAADPDPGPSKGIPGDGTGEGVPPPASAGEFPADLAALSRSVRRTPARNTRALVDALDALVELGLPQAEAFRVGMGRLPVAGYANWSHDWWFPRFGPGWRLHLGTDVFATNGTPVRSPTEGTVRLSRGGLGGISAYVVQGDGTYFYFAHLEGYADGIADGTTVATGDVIGFVGTSGNASGGAAHLHFEYHPAPTKVITKGRGKARTTEVVTVPVRPGTTLPAVDPKAWLDQALQDAIADVPRIVAEYQTHPELIPAPPPEAPPAIDAAAEAATIAASVVGRPVAATSAVRKTSIAQFPLAAFALLLIVLVASLTPVYAPRRIGPGPQPPVSPEGGGGDGDRSERRVGRRARRRAATAAATGENVPDGPIRSAAAPEPRTGRRRARKERRSGPDGTGRRGRPRRRTKRGAVAGDADAG